MARRHLSQIGHLRGARAARDEIVETRGYPRPLLRRGAWISLDGKWEFAIDDDARFVHPAEVAWTRQILVPFSPETRMSGVHETGLFKAVWYRRYFEFAPLEPDERLLVHFGAVDYRARVWIDGSLAGSHEGGYTPFRVDATTLLSRKKTLHEIVVHAEDDPGDLDKPRGKQDWQLEPHSIWYPRTTGIWQPVWCERVPQTRIERIVWTGNVERWEIGFEAQVLDRYERDLRLRVELGVGDVRLARDEYDVVTSGVHRRIALSDPGIDDFRNELLWSPMSPTLIEADVQLIDERGGVIDAVRSYTALRSFCVQGDKLVLNGRPYPLRMVLDQGYWQDSGMTAPSDAALRADVELAKRMGFNGVRKHQKIEDPRYLYWADHLGLLVWEEMPSAYRFTRQSVERLCQQWLEALERDVSHPCIVAWVPFNESWGVPNLPQSEPERQYVRALYHLTKTIDSTRPVVGNDGWESIATDIIGIHDYDDDPKRLERRYSDHDVVPKLLAHERPGGRKLVLDHLAAIPEIPIVLSEFGGIAFAPASEGSWGYSRADTAKELSLKYEDLLHTVASLNLLAGFCYTQFADTYQETNGLLYADRTPKFPLDQIASATARALPLTQSEPALGGRERAP